MSHQEVLESELHRVHIDLPSPQKIKLASYCDELVHWNEKINLTGLAGADLVRRLVVEPVWIGLQLKPAGVLADIGSGNGSPAIPLQVVCDFQHCHLIEVRAKRAAFLRKVTAALKLPRTDIHRSRFEEVAPTLGCADWITLQGVSLDEKLLDAIFRTIATTATTIVWITSSSARSPLQSKGSLRVPFTETRIFLFGMDLS